MNPRVYCAVWGGSFFIAIAIFLFVMDRGHDSVDEWAAIELDDAEVAVIGSSLSRCAFPFANVSGGILGDNRDHKVLTKPNLSEREALLLWGALLHHEVTTIVIEVNDFTSDFLYDTGNNDLIFDFYRWRRLVPAFFRRGIHSIIGYERSELFPNDISLEERFHSTLSVESEPPRQARNVRLRRPIHAALLNELLVRSRSEGVEVLFFRPPVSEANAKILTPHGLQDVLDHTASFIESTGFMLWQPQGPWPNSAFFDRTHLNERGRERFLREFRDWYIAVR